MLLLKFTTAGDHVGEVAVFQRKFNSTSSQRHLSVIVLSRGKMRQLQTLRRMVDSWKVPYCLVFLLLGGTICRTLKR